MKEQNKKIKLDDLLDKSEPLASFHDAALYNLQIDYEKKEMTAEFELFVGNPDGKTEMERERVRRGILKISGLLFWSLEPPNNKDTDTWGPLWLTSYGLIEEALTDTAKKLTSILKPEVFGLYLYFSNINAFAYLGAEEAVFEWKNA